MAVTIPIKFFNTFIITNGVTGGNQVAWHVEESRINGGFNEASVDLGVKAYVTDEDYTRERKQAGIIYSGIFNSTTGLNDTNQFSVGQTISKQLDATNGSIQKMYTEDTALLILQEDKVSRTLVDKSAIFSASGGGTLTSSDKVIGEVIPYAGQYGISKNPESFAVYGGRKYFTDKNRGSVLRLSQDGITEISNAGMKSFFRDGLRVSRRLYGMYDTHHNQYVLCLNNESDTPIGGRSRFDPPDPISYTLSFDEDAGGWTSFFSYIPRFGGSLNGYFYTNKKGDLWQHYATNDRNTFYGANPAVSFVTLILNDESSSVKVFKTVNYEGSNGWGITSMRTNEDSAWPIVDHASGFFINSDGYPDRRGFNKVESKYYSSIKNNTTAKSEEVIFGSSMSGIKGFFNVITISNNYNDTQELYSVSSEFETSSY
jgi:hypothetical protein